MQLILTAKVGLNPTCTFLHSFPSAAREAPSTFVDKGSPTFFRIYRILACFQSKEDGKDLAREGKALLDAFKSAMASRGAADALGTPLGRFCDLFVEVNTPFANPAGCAPFLALHLSPPDLQRQSGSL